MSFNNPLNFSISKSTPTTSTTNTTSTIAEKEPTVIPDAVTASNSAFLQNILSINSSSLDKSSPTKSLNLLLRTSVAPQITKTDEPPQISTDGDNKRDLLNLFDRFDINNSHYDSKLESVVSNEKISMDEDEKLNYDDIHDDLNNSSEMIEIRNANLKTEDVEKNDSVETYEANKIEIDHPTDDLTKNQDRQEDIQDFNNVKTENLFPVEKESDNVTNETLLSVENIKDSSLVKIENLEDVNNTIAQSTNEPEHSQMEAQPDFEASNEDLIQFDNPTIVNGSLTTSENVVETIPKLESLETDEFRNSDTTEGDDVEINEYKETKGEEEDLIENTIDKTKKIQSTVIDQQHQQSHKPFDFQTFLTQLRKKSADPIVRYIRSFLVSLTRQGHTFTAEQRIKIVSDFKTFMNEKFSIFEPFASMDEIDLENSREGLEKLMMNRLYDQCFPPEVAKQEVGHIPESFLKDLKDDELFAEQYEKYSWVNATHLDIDLVALSKDRRGDTNFIEYAIIELNKINDYRAPRDKIICILNACKIIFGFLKLSNQETNADSFIPILIMVIIKAKTDHLISNLHYIENYRGEEWLTKGETSYYLSSVQAAVTFILNLSKDDLTIDDKEFDAHMEAWEAEKVQKIAAIQKTKILQPHPRKASAQIPNSDSLSPSSVLLTSAEMFTKSISQLLSPSPQVEGSETTNTTPPNVPSRENVPQTESGRTSDNSELMKETYENLKEIFNELDRAIMKDIVFMNNGDFEKSLDQCLELVNEV